LPEHLDSNAVAQALAQLIPPYAEQLVGLEVVWSPSEGDDRLSSAELEAVYPELLPMQGAEAFGRVSCGYCHAIYARELLHCPACGANDPRTSRAATTGYATIACRYCGRQTPSYEVQCQHCGARAAN
jgi:RNA polymerase subunit RPABC4/transcription elongation factor Spt4